MRSDNLYLESFELQMEHIIKALRTEGYDASKQLMGYIITGDNTYITRTGNARAMIAKLDKKEIRNYLEENYMI